MQMALDWTAPRARASDPDTSQAAGEGAREFAARHAAKIYSALIESGPMNYCEIARATGLERHAVNRRLPEMREQGLVRRMGVRTPGDSGRMCHVYEAIRGVVR